VEIGELQFYFRKITLHQQKFLVVSVKRFSVGNTKVNILVLTAGLKNKIRLSSDNFVKLRTQSSP